MEFQFHFVTKFRCNSCYKIARKGIHFGDIATVAYCEMLEMLSRTESR